MFSTLHWTLLLCLAAALLVAGGAVRLRGTTLAAPGWWATGSLVLIAAVEVVAARDVSARYHADPVRYAAAVTALCPIMAVLGAKRPQDRAWQWVVLALLATLWLPAAKALLLNRGEEMDVFPAWQVFVAVLILLGPLNYLPTANWLPSLLVASGQGLLLAPFVSVVESWSGVWRLPAAMAAFFLAALIVWLRVRQRRRRMRATAPLEELNTAWFRFRNAFGAFWAVRVEQRVNQGLHSAGSCLELTWQGWVEAPDRRPSSALSQDAESALTQASRTMRTVLRRFVRRD